MIRYGMGSKSMFADVCSRDAGCIVAHVKLSYHTRVFFYINFRIYSYNPLSPYLRVSPQSETKPPKKG